jgi:hypothetical protein
VKQDVVSLARAGALIPVAVFWRFPEWRDDDETQLIALLLD